MSNMSPAFAISLMVTIVCALAMIPVFLLTRLPGQAKRLMDVTRAPLRLDEEPAEKENPAKLAVQPWCALFAPGWAWREDEKLRQKLLAAGLRDRSAADTYFGIRLLGPVVAMRGRAPSSAATLSSGLPALMALAYLAPGLLGDYQHRTSAANTSAWACPMRST